MAKTKKQETRSGAPVGVLPSEPSMTPLDEFIKRCGNVAEAARRLDVSYMQLRRWARRDAFAGRSSRKLAAELGVTLPTREV